jgi:Na+-transporting NADH:ubiquinone oxidoreductase subunit F
MSFLLSLAVMNGLSLLVLILILLLKRFVYAAGEVSVTINSGKKITGNGGIPLSKMLFENKIFVPSACGGKGTCGFCKVRITEGLLDPLPVEEMILNFKDLREGYRLSCQTKVKSDIAIELPEELLSIKEYFGTVIESKPVTRDIKRIRIEIVEPKEGIDFKSGQYVLVEVANAETRAYSIASSVSLKNEIQLEVKLIPNGLGSSFLHSLSGGDRIRFFGPYGQFYLRDTRHKVVCVAGGVGLAPMKPIIDDVLRRYPNRNIELYYGSRTIEDLYDHELFAKWRTSFERFTYYPCLENIDPAKAGDYPIEEGFVSKSIIKHLADGDKSEAYLCGPPAMIEAAIKVLIERGVPEIRILYDKFL